MLCRTRTTPAFLLEQPAHERRVIDVVGALAANHQSEALALLEPLHEQFEIAHEAFKVTPSSWMYTRSPRGEAAHHGQVAAPPPHHLDDVAALLATRPA